MNDLDPWEHQGPLPVPAAARSVASCAASSGRLLWRDRLLWPHARVGTRLRFADGTTGRIFRETVLPEPRVDPCLLVVTFRPALLRGAGHRAFEQESILSTPLFVGFPGFRSKLWVAADELGRYRGIYNWDGARRAVSYARSLWRVLALGSVPGSIAYRVVPGVTVSELLQGRVTVSDRRREGWWVPLPRPALKLELIG